MFSLPPLGSLYWGIKFEDGVYFCVMNQEFCLQPSQAQNFTVDWTLRVERESIV